jgi:hypothetical protein
MEADKPGDGAGGSAAEGSGGRKRALAEISIWTGEGAGVKLELPPTATVLMVKEGVERECGIAACDARLFLHKKSREIELKDEETLQSLGVAGADEEIGEIEMSLLVQGKYKEQVSSQFPHQH